MYALRYYGCDGNNDATMMNNETVLRSGTDGFSEDREIFLRAENDSFDSFLLG